MAVPDELEHLRAEVARLRAAVNASLSTSRIGEETGTHLAAPGSEEWQLRTDRTGQRVRFLDARLAALLGVAPAQPEDAPVAGIDRLPGCPGLLRQLLDEALGKAPATVERRVEVPAADASGAPRHLALRATATPRGCVLVVRDDTRRRRLETVVGRYASPLLVEALVQHPADFFAPQRVEATLLFCDLVNYSGNVARLRPEEVGRLLNAFFRVGITVVEAHRGMVVQFVGDELMVAFGTPLADADHALNACRCALGLLRAHETVRAVWRHQGLPELGIRIGVATGEALAGNLGDERRAAWCVVGQPTNLAARMLAAADPGQALCTRATREAAVSAPASDAPAPAGAPRAPGRGPGVSFRALPEPVMAKNLGPVEAFEILP